MKLYELSNSLPNAENPPLVFRFSVVFFTGGRDANTLDILFQKVSGLRSSVETIAVEEGGQNLYSQSLPRKVKYENLVLERGLVVKSTLGSEFETAMSLFKFRPADVLITLYDQERQPVVGWLCLKAYPVKWSVSDPDANSNSVMIEHMELTFQNMQVIRS
jgi:phage tail-like protein